MSDQGYSSDQDTSRKVSGSKNTSDIEITSDSKQTDDGDDGSNLSNSPHGSPENIKLSPEVESSGIEIPPGESDIPSSTVHTADCAPASPPKPGNKYKLNADFNLRPQSQSSVRNKTSRSLMSDPSFQEWMPAVLRGQKWPSERKKDENENPYLSVSAKTDTIIKNSGLGEEDDAEWRKYRNQEFVKHLNQNNFGQATSSLNERAAPDTFANRSKNSRAGHRSLSESFTPSSPLKLFGDKQDTYTKSKFKDILGYVNKGDEKVDGKTDENDGDEKIHHMIKGADNIYNKVVASAKAAAQLPDANAESSVTYSEDYTSDADEFNSDQSGPTVSAKALYKNGDDIYQNLKRKFSQPLPAPGSEVSDYTSEGEDGERFGSPSAGPSPLVNETLSPEKAPESSVTSISTSHQDINHDLPDTSLEALRHQFDISLGNLGHASRPVSAPQILGDSTINTEKSKSSATKYKGMNFIPAEDYKDKIFDKRQDKYVPKEEYERIYGDGNTEASESTSSFEESPKEKPEVSFRLPEKPLAKASANNSTVAELSFSQTNAALVSAITETYPEEDWDYVEQLSITGKQLDKLRGLDKFTPHLWLLDASDNQISLAQGIPNSVQILKLNTNNFTSLAAFDLPNLHVLELSHNTLRDLSGLSSLINLSSLTLDSNVITNIDHLENLRMLKTLKMSNNRIAQDIDFSKYELWVLEDLFLDNNEITALLHLESLPNLVYLSANRNRIRKITCEGVIHKNLKRLSLDSNKLPTLDLSSFPNLVRLSISRNNLRHLSGLPASLEMLSCKYQDGLNGTIPSSIIRGSCRPGSLIRNITFSGSKIDFDMLLPQQNVPHMFSCITELDLSACGIKQLPDNFSSLFPLLLHLNLNFNSITTLKGLDKLYHIRTLNALGNSIQDLGEVLGHTEAARRSLQFLDLRVNPVTRSFYPYVFYDPEGKTDREFIDSQIISSTNLEDDEVADETTMLNLKDYDDIEAFSVEYKKLYEKDQLDKWSEKDTAFDQKQGGLLSREKQTYQTRLILWFNHIRWLDGLKITAKRRRREHHQFGKVMNSV